MWAIIGVINPLSADIDSAVESQQFRSHRRSTFCFRDLWLRSTLPSLQHNPSSGKVLLVEGVSFPAIAAVLYNPDRPVTGLSANWT